jgi:hypothetical protein
MNLINQVYDTLKLKKSDAYCAEKLGITLEKYHSIKQQILNVKSLIQDDMDDMMKDILSKKMMDLIDDREMDLYITELEDQLVSTLNQQKEKVVEFNENLDEGTAEIKGIAFVEPKSPEEIIRILKIDTEKWKLSQYWNKQHKDYWLVSALVSQKKLDPNELLANTLGNFKPKYLPVKEIVLNDKFSNPTVGVLSLQDLHFGKENNEDIVSEFKKAVENLTYRAYASSLLSKIIYVVGGDLLNMDGFNGSTTKGTVVDNSLRAQDAYNQAFDSLYWSVNFLKQFCEQLHVVYLPGNHDRLSSYHLAHALSRCFQDSNIYFDVEYSERKVVVSGDNFFGFEHGDVTSKNSPLLYATEFSKEWGETKYRTVYTGHFHTKRTVEYKTENEVHGFAVKHLPSLCKSDYWHYHNKYTGSKRQAIMEIHDLSKGKISEFTYTV